MAAPPRRRAYDGALDYLGRHMTTQWPGAVDGLNLGSVEAAVMSGMLASRAICQSPAKLAREGELY